MSRTTRRIKIYMIIFLILLIVAVFLPTIMETISSLFYSEQAYYAPHDLQREDFLRHRENR